MANKVSNDQLDELLDFLAEHPAIAKGVGLGARSKEAVDRQWNDLAQKHNSYGSGSTKSGERWKKYWADLKHKSKTRLSKRRREALGTGGGPSSQDDLSEVDKKVLAIIGEQAVFGDSVHKVPVFNTETKTGSQEIGPQCETEDLTVVANSPPAVVNTPPAVVNSPSRSGHTSLVYSTIVCEPTTAQQSNSDASASQTQQVLEPPQAGVESPVGRPIIADRRCLRRNTAPNTTIPSRISPEWVMELEISRTEAETKLANAALIMAESAKVQADTARAQADLTRQLLEIICRQSNDIKALLEMMRAANQH